MHCVGPGACEGLNTQDQARRLIAETGHHLQDMISPITHLVLLFKSSSVPAAPEGKWCDHHQRDLSSVFMTVGDADTSCSVLSSTSG